MAQMPFPVLIGDIGGTNARFQVLEGSDSGHSPVIKVETQNFATVEDAIEDVLSRLGGLRPRSAALAAAGPITSIGLDLTNCDWAIVADAFLTRLELNQLVLFNDFDAQALALPALTGDHLTSDVGLKTANKAVLGPGTGLGVAGLVHTGHQWAPVAFEGGHVDLGPRSTREVAIWHHLERFDGRVSGESILCGSGLQRTYRAICAADGLATTLATPATISSAALSGSDETALEALRLFCTCLGRVAGDLALTMKATGGVYVSGGIIPAILPFFETSDFRAAFEDKAPHRHIMKDIATCVITDPHPALIGLRAYVERSEEYALPLDGRSWRSST